MAATLVMAGIYGYDPSDGTFWKEVDDLIGPCNHTDLGRFFEKYVRLGRHASFPRTSLGGMRYVSLILMHGGLPVKALPRFVEQVVPTLMQHQWASPSQLGLLAAEAAERHRLPLVVQRYFRYGGRIAGEFAARAAELARRFLSESDNSALAISAQEIGLP
ncbi:MAG: hypothetical protein LCH53_14630, partial [Bacteroidetes bacterium]|nr:hypothetical protein [Bacteroidota bacterium]